MGWRQKTHSKDIHSHMMGAKACGCGLQFAQAGNIDTHIIEEMVVESAEICDMLLLRKPRATDFQFLLEPNKCSRSQG